MRNELQCFDGSRDELAIFLQLTQGLQGLVKSSFGARGGAYGERDQTLVAGANEVFGVPKDRFHGAETTQTPEVLREFIDENLFGGVGGLVLGAELGSELIEFGSGFIRENERFGIEAVLERVLGTAPLAFRGAGAGGLVGGVGQSVGLGDAAGFAGLLGETALGGAADGTWAHVVAGSFV